MQNSNSFKQMGQDSGCRILAEWIEINEPHFSQCQSVPCNSGLTVGRFVSPVMNIKTPPMIRVIVPKRIPLRNCQLLQANNTALSIPNKLVLIRALGTGSGQGQLRRSPELTIRATKTLWIALSTFTVFHFRERVQIRCDRNSLDKRGTSV